MLLGPDLDLSKLTATEKLHLRDRLAEMAARLGISVLDPDAPPSLDTPGELVRALDPRRVVQRDHLRVIDTALRWVHDTPDAALMIWTPPQVGKSWRVSRAFPFWWLTHNPTDRILLGSWGLSLARSHCLATRTLIRNHGAAYGLLRGEEEWTSTDWTLLSGGGMRARGVGGGIAGFPAHLGLIDDPYANRAAADSPTIRETVWGWYSGDFLSRLAPGAREVITMTRWHPNDLCGELLKRDGRLEDGGRWKVVHLPAIAVAPDPARGFRDDPLGREPGEPLPHPAIAEGDTKALLKYWAHRKAISVLRDWNSMYQGSPFRTEGAQLTEQELRDRTAIAPTEFRRRAVGIDPSGGGRDSAGLVAGGVSEDRKLWITHDWTGHMTSGQWSDKACELAALTGADLFVIESNYGGDQGTELLKRSWFDLRDKGKLLGPGGKRIRKNAPMPRVVMSYARKSKVLRAEPIAQAVKLGAIWFARGAHLNQLKTEWVLWEPDSTWSPGALDACVHMAYEILPSPVTATTHSVAGRSRGASKEGAVAARRVNR